MTAAIVGIDEAGRGALAGPVVAGACMLEEVLCKQAFIKDSKQLEPNEREEAYEWIITTCTYGVGMVDASVIDEIGILAATERAMQHAVAEIATQITPTYLLIDGRDKFWFDYPHSSVIKGDEKEPCIAAGSIVAKVTRDRLMIEMDSAFQNYGFFQHKGYGTPEHFSAIKKLGMTTVHRKTFVHPTSTTETLQQEKSAVCTPVPLLD